MKVERTSLRDAVHDRLRQKILDRELPPGTALSEPALAAELGVSRSPLREALLTLEFEGLLSSEVHRGFSVRSLDERTIAEVYPVLGVLEGLAVRQSTPRLRERVPELREINARIRRAGKPPRKMAALDHRFHELLVADCPNGNLARLRETLWCRARLFDRPSERGVAAIERSYDQHEEILCAVEEGRLARAARLVERHWESGVAVVMRWLRENEPS